MVLPPPSSTLSDFANTEESQPPSPEIKNGPPSEALSEFAAPQMNEDKSNSPLEMAIGAAESFGKGYAGPLFTGAERIASSAGIPNLTPEDQERRSSAHPLIQGVVGTGGFLAGALTGTGEAGLLSDVGNAIPGIGTLGKIGSGAVRAGAESLLFGAGDEASKWINNAPQTAESVLHNIGLYGLIGAGVGGTLGALLPRDWEGIKDETEQGIQSFKNSIGGSVLDHETEAPLQDIHENSFSPKSGSSGAEIQSIGEKNNWPVLEGMVNKGKTVQMAEDALVSGQPTFASIARTKAYDDALKAVTTSVDQASGSTSSLTETQAGNALKASLLNKLEERHQPIKDLYSEIEPYRAAIPLSDRSSGALNRTINQIIEDQGLVPGSDRYNFIKTFADGIGNVDNLQKLANFRTEVNRSSGPLTKDLAGAIGDKLDGVEGRAISRFADTMKTSDAKNKILDLIDKSNQAKSSYSSFREQLQTLGNSIGKKKIYGPQNFMDFLEEMNPQSLARRLFNENNTEFSQYFAKQFPEEMSVMRNYQRGLIRQNAMQDGTLNASKAIKQVFSLEPEMQKLLFRPKELETIGEAKKYIDSFPKKFNPSGTSHMSAFRQFFESPVSAATSNIRDFGIQGFIKAMGKLSPGAESEAETLLSVLGRPVLKNDPDAEGLRDSTRYVVNAIRGDASMNRIAKGLLIGFLPEIKNTLDSSGLNHLDASVKNYQNNPDLIQGVGKKVSYYLGDHDVALKAMASNVINHLNQIRPKSQKNGIFDAELKPSLSQMSSYNRALQIAQQPLSIVNFIKDGTLNSTDVNNLKSMYPALSQRFTSKIMDQLAGHLSKGGTIPYEKRLALSNLVGQPLDSTLTPMAMQSILKSAGGAQSQTGAQGPNKKATGVALKQIDQSNALIATNSQARQINRRA